MDVVVEVSGHLPPAKGEAKSMLSDGHPQSERVRALLNAAAAAMAGREPLAGPLSLVVALHVRAGTRTPDATNMLGGIGDVLQTRTTGADVAHLGALGSAGCFLDDAQIQHIRYDQLEATSTGYRIEIREVD